MTLRPALSLALVVALAAGCESRGYREVEVDLSAAPPPASAPAAAPRRALRFSVAAIESPRDTYATYSRLFERVGERMGMPVEFVQRRTYREVNDLILSGEIDAALVCTGGYLDLRRRAPGAADVVAVPVSGGVRTYEAIVIVPASSAARSLVDLAGKRFAFTDELSFSGHLYLRRQILDMKLDPARFFSSTVFTQNHDRSVAAVARGLVDGAAVHSRVYDHLVRADPALARNVRIIHRSPPFGAMPVVASMRLAPETRARLREVLLELARDPQGGEALAVLHIDGFDVPTPGLYDGAARVVEGLR